MRELTVAMVMTKDTITVTPDTEFKDIVEILTRYSISAVPVVGGDGVPIGVVSEADLTPKQERPEPPSLLASKRARQSWHKASAGRAVDLMAVPVRAVEASESVSFAARELHRRGVRRLFVMDHGRLVGVVSRRDLLKVFLRSDEEIRADIEHEVFQRVLWADPTAITVAVNRGVVTLTGQLDRRSEVEIAGRLTTTIPGVVDVRNRLDCAWNDQAHN
ncbi:CBS domain-containing protein [Kibdelosporangium philippinense]|uniref:CBS domain-containing protein n=2 Tax=Kibdelosporangium philippinense TaxID=211113 RepID=A0ABS8ZFK6_9PSEU|nr:CBS domain-containing protein [Kibdelosporangium philippinense]MCE7004617.1 CBS domain-containing protein [Kibdelosporangium philippinense]